MKERSNVIKIHLGVPGAFSGLPPVKRYCSHFECMFHNVRPRYPSCTSYRTSFNNSLRESYLWLSLSRPSSWLPSPIPTHYHTHFCTSVLILVRQTSVTSYCSLVVLFRTFSYNSVLSTSTIVLGPISKLGYFLRLVLSLDLRFSLVLTTSVPFEIPPSGLLYVPSFSIRET